MVDKARVAKLMQRMQSDTPDGPGVLGAFLQGTREGSFPAGETEVPIDAAPEGLTPPPSVMTQEEYDRLRARNLGKRQEYVAPTNAVERFAEGVGRAAPTVATAAAFAPLTAGGSMLAIPAELAAGAAGVSASEVAREQGVGPVGQFLADVGASVAAPGVGFGVVARMAGRGKSQVPKVRRAAAKQVARALAQQGYKATSQDAYRVAKRLGAEIATGTDDPDRFVREVIANLKRTEEQFAGGTMPSLAQAAGESSGFGFTADELRLAKYDPTYRAAARGRRRETLERVGEEFQESVPLGGYGNATEAFDEAYTASDDLVRAAWADVPFDEMPVLSPNRLKRAVDSLQVSDAKRKYLPEEVSTILGYGDTITARELQDLRSEVLTGLRLGQRHNASDAAIRAKPHLVQILKAIDATETGGLPVKQSSKLKEARRLTAEHKDRFNPKRAGVETLSERTDPRALLRRLRTAKDPGDEAANLVEIMADSPQGLDGLRATLYEDVFGLTMGDKTVRAMTNKLTEPRTRAIFDEVFEPEQIELMEIIVDKWAKASRGKAGTSAQAASTGTGYEMLDNMFSFGRASSPEKAAQMARAGFKKLRGGTKAEAALFKLATQDIRIARMLLEELTPEKVPAMRSLWNQTAYLADEIASRSKKRAPGVPSREFAGQGERGQED